MSQKSNENLSDNQEAAENVPVEQLQMETEDSEDRQVVERNLSGVSSLERILEELDEEAKTGALMFVQEDDEDMATDGNALEDIMDLSQEESEELSGPEDAVKIQRKKVAKIIPKVAPQTKKTDPVPEPSKMTTRAKPKRARVLLTKIPPKVAPETKKTAPVPEPKMSTHAKPKPTPRQSVVKKGAGKATKNRKSLIKKKTGARRSTAKKPKRKSNKSKN